MGAIYRRGEGVRFLSGLSSGGIGLQCRRQPIFRFRQRQGVRIGESLIQTGSDEA
jgi:hypothetical protein